jgi:hypothetical protein
MVVFEAGSVGAKEQRHAAIDLPPFEHSEDDGGILVRDLIALAVEVRLDAEREARTEEAALWREIDEMTGCEGDGNERAHSITTEPLAGARAAAWAGFERERYYLIVDGRRMRQLHERVPIGSDSRVTFLRKLEYTGG